MRLIKKSLPEADYKALTSFIYQENDQIDNFEKITIAPHSSVDDLDPVSRVIKNFLVGRKSSPNIDDKYVGKGNSILLKGEEITRSMFIESVDFFLKAFSNFSAQYNLAKRGYISLAKITNYYSSFFAINALLRLQGRAISRIWKPQIGTRFYIFPFKFSNDNFVVCYKRFREGEHQIIWKEYYNLYDRYNFRNKDFYLVRLMLHCTEFKRKFCMQG